MHRYCGQQSGYCGMDHIFVLCIISMSDLTIKALFRFPLILGVFVRFLWVTV